MVQLHMFLQNDWTPHI